MTWFLIILNIAGGEPAFIEMPTQAACQAALDASPGVMSTVKAWCIPAGDWDGKDHLVE